MTIYKEGDRSFPSVGRHSITALETSPFPTASSALSRVQNWKRERMRIFLALGSAYIYLSLTLERCVLGLSAPFGTHLRSENEPTVPFFPHVDVIFGRLIFFSVDRRYVNNLTKPRLLECWHSLHQNSIDLWKCFPTLIGDQSETICIYRTRRH